MNRDLKYKIILLVEVDRIITFCLLRGSVVWFGALMGIEDNKTTRAIFSQQ